MRECKRRVEGVEKGKKLKGRRKKKKEKEGKEGKKKINNGKVWHGDDMANICVCFEPPQHRHLELCTEMPPPQRPVFFSHLCARIGAVDAVIRFRLDAIPHIGATRNASKRGGTPLRSPPALSVIAKPHFTIEFTTAQYTITQKQQTGNLEEDLYS